MNQPNLDSGICEDDTFHACNIAHLFSLDLCNVLGVKFIERGSAECTSTCTSTAARSAFSKLGPRSLAKESTNRRTMFTTGAPELEHTYVVTYSVSLWESKQVLLYVVQARAPMDCTCCAHDLCSTGGSRCREPTVQLSHANTAANV